jgi:hypothetical protein
MLRDSLGDELAGIESVEGGVEPQFHGEVMPAA